MTMPHDVARWQPSSLTLLALALVCTVGWSANLGFMPVVKYWGIEPMLPSFGDARVITAGYESMRQGFDPLVENPMDPWRRRMNYPRIWQSLVVTGIDQSHTARIGVTLGLLFAVACLVLAPPREQVFDNTVFSAALISPPVILCVERGNIDLLIFALMIMHMWVISRHSGFLSAGIAFAILLAAFLLKLYPIFAAVAFLRYSRRIVFCVAVIGVAFCALYLIRFGSDLKMIRQATPAATTLSFGADVLWTQISRTHPGSLALICRIVSGLILVLSLSLIPWHYLNRSLGTRAVSGNIADLTAFRIGAGIYVGVFALGNNYDYRLIFSLLTVRYLAQLSRSQVVPGSMVSRQRVAQVILVGLFLSLWHLGLLLLLGRALGDDGYHLAFIVDELANWVVTVGYCWLLGTTFSDQPDEVVFGDSVMALCIGKRLK